MTHSIIKRTAAGALAVLCVFSSTAAGTTGTIGGSVPIYASAQGGAVQDISISTASLTLDDGFGLNFYVEGLESTEGYSVKFTGDCEENGLRSALTEKNGKICATANINAKNICHKIRAELFKDGEAEPVCVYECSAEDYLISLLDMDGGSKKLTAMAEATLDYGYAADNYFNAAEHDLSGLYTPTAGDLAQYDKVSKEAAGASVSLVLRSKVKLRVYSENGDQTSKYGKYTEIAGLTPVTMGRDHTIDGYTVSGYTWVSRVLSASGSGANDVIMAKALYGYMKAAESFVAVNLSELEEQNDPSSLDDLTVTLKDGDIVTGTLSGAVILKIEENATITLSNVTITGENQYDLGFPGLSAEGNTNIILEGTNTVNSSYSGAPGIYIGNGGTLTISGTGELNAAGGLNGAGIGAAGKSYDELDYRSAGNIIINSGTVNAQGGIDGAGIGSAGDDTSCGTITVNGGTVSAKGGIGTAGIGSGESKTATCGDITINGGTVEAAGGDGGSGIGAGSDGNNNSSTVTINGGTVKAYGGSGAAGIGAANRGLWGDIIITGGNITATAGDGAAGIGAAFYGSCGNITISGGTVNAKGGEQGAGIGAGVGISYGGYEAYKSLCGDITITDQVKSVTAEKGADAVHCIGRGAELSECGIVSIGGNEGFITDSPYTYEPGK